MTGERRTETRSAVETEAVGAKLADRLAAGDVVIVSGEVGAGKTTLIRGAARALGVTEPVTSPTFTIGRQYAGGRLPISHLDLYRLEDLEGEDPALLDDYLGGEGVAFVEWPAAGAGRLGRPVLEVCLEHAGEERRTIEIVDYPGTLRRTAAEGPGRGYGRDAEG